MRKLVWLTIGFGAACGLCVWVLPRELLMKLALCAAATAALAAVPGRRRPPLRPIGMALLGCAMGLAWYSLYYSIYLNTAVAMDAVTQDACIRVTDYSCETAYGIGADGTITLAGKPFQVRAYLDGTQALEPGDVLRGSFRFRVTTPDGAEEATFHSGKGIFLLAYQTDEITVSKSASAWRDIPAKLREQLKTILDACFSEETAPFAKALLLGDTAQLGYETDTNLKISGIRHVAAVSGLHVSILFALLGAVTFRRRYLMALTGIPVLLLFAAVAGFTPSVTRACIMSGLMLLALLFNREYDCASALSFAVLVMLAVNPLAVTSVSLSLSVGSVAGICLFNPGIRRWLLARFGKSDCGKCRAMGTRWLTGSVSVTLSAMVFTTPLCAWYFGTVSLIGVVTNLLCLWVISFVFYGLMAVCLLYFLWPAGAALLAGVVAIPIRCVLFVAGTLANIPLAAVYTRSPYITAWLIFVYVLLALFLVTKNKRPVLLSCCAAIGLCCALLASWAEPVWGSETQLTVLNVGQGQCLLIQNGGRTYMVDCGGDSDSAAADIAAETLLSQGITRLDGLILTHCDRDHAGAVENLLTRVETDLLILPPVSSGLPECTSGQVIYAESNLCLSYDETVISIYAPTFPGNSNEKSLCILFDTEKCDILITGDRSGFGERMLLRNAEIPDVDILIAGHHGSKNSTCEELLQAVRPEIVCISVGEGNSYGHPAPELLQRLNAYGCAIYRTDENGDIRIRR